MELFQLTCGYNYIFFLLHLNHQKSINLHSLICVVVLEYDLSDSKIGNDKNTQSCTWTAIFIVYKCHMI